MVIIYKHFIYKQFFPNHELSLKEMETTGNGIQWFALEPSYGSYGPILHTYQLKKFLHLIDLGLTKNRRKIIRDLKSRVPNIAHLINPDEQYSGGPGNKKLHEILKKYYYNKYDGTIIDSSLADEENQGATEIVLWKDHSQLLKRVA